MNRSERRKRKFVRADNPNLFIAIGWSFATASGPTPEGGVVRAVAASIMCQDDPDPITLIIPANGIDEFIEQLSNARMELGRIQ